MIYIIKKITKYFMMDLMKILINKMIINQSYIILNNIINNKIYYS